MSDQLNFVDCLRLVKGGLATWKEKPHNAKWWKRIDGTPIPNDLCVCIAEAFVAEAALRAETPAPREPFNPRADAQEIVKWQQVNPNKDWVTVIACGLEKAYQRGRAGEPEQAK